MRLAGRSCSTLGCSAAATTGSRCEACRKVWQERQDRRRGSPTERGYDQAHQALRIAAFQRDGWTCVDCGWKPEIIRQCEEFELGEPPLAEVLAALRTAHNRGEKHLHGDHVIPIEDRPDLRLELSNYGTRCNECHGAKTLRELSRKIFLGGAGQISEPRCR